MTITDMKCCGLREVSGLEWRSSAKEAMTEFMKEACPASYSWSGNYKRKKELNFSHVIFSEAREYRGQESYGERFAAFIKKNKLGTVTASHRRVNPNSGNPVKCWIWTLSKENLVKWANDNIKKDKGIGFGVARF